MIIIIIMMVMMMMIGGEGGGMFSVYELGLYDKNKTYPHPHL